MNNFVIIFFICLIIIASALIVFKLIQMIYTNLRRFRKNSPEIATKELVKDIKDAKRTLYIYSGLCDKSVFNRDEVKEELENKKGVIDIIIVVEGNLEEDNRVREYLKNKLINDLRRTEKTFPEYHFRIVDDKRLYLEKHGLTYDINDNSFKIISKITLIEHFKKIFFKIYQNGDVVKV